MSDMFPSGWWVIPALWVAAAAAALIYLGYWLAG